MLAMFRGTVNPTTGRLEWLQQDRDVTSEESDLSPELARWTVEKLVYSAYTPDHSVVFTCSPGLSMGICFTTDRG